MIPKVDLVVLSRDQGPLHAAVERSLRNQRGVQAVVHRVLGQRRPDDPTRQTTIARARNEGKECGDAPWLMFVDDDVVLSDDCVLQLVEALHRRPAFGALAADYLGQRRRGEISNHVAMGATLFRREALEQIRFRWDGRRCECQGCCDDLRRRHWAIGYHPTAIAKHLPKSERERQFSPVTVAPQHEAACRSFDTRRIRLPSVCLVVCYFGAPPRWINHYLLSCAYNPSIDFLIFTDQDNFPATPRNVHVERLDAPAFNSLATSKLGFQVNLSRPYKLCDFKPTYGHLFEDRLAGWDYWGYADVDVIYGDIRRFLSSARFNRFDIFSARKEFLAGHFSLFRNTSRMRTLYQQSADYRRTLQSPETLSFDECGMQWGRRLQGKPLTDAASCDSMMHVITRMARNNKISPCYAAEAFEWPHLAAKSHWRLEWRAGRLWSVEQRREAMYLHFNAFRNRPGFRQPRRFDFDTAFDISPNGFEPAAAP